ncbi:MAG: hypothetical protein KAR19_13965 [Bacteroidales bacterium]|nr:hypothetical protein [Bacteroidales bacterium]
MRRFCTRIYTMSWDAYHEARDLIKQVEAYKSVHEHYLELIRVDKIYATSSRR